MMLGLAERAEGRATGGAIGSGRRSVEGAGDVWRVNGERGAPGRVAVQEAG